MLRKLPNYCFLSGHPWETAIQASRQYIHRYTRLSCSQLSQDQELIRMVNGHLSAQTLLTALILLTLFVWSWCCKVLRDCEKNLQRSVHPSRRGGKTTIPISHLCPVECWDCSGDCRFSINLEMQLDTGASDREGETLSRSITSLACRSYKRPDWFI